MKINEGIKRITILGVCSMTALGMMSLTACGGATGFPYDAYNLGDYIKVGKYKGLTVNDYTITVSEKEVLEAVGEAVKAATKDVDLKKGDKIKDGDTVNIDYVGTIGGKAFDGGSAQGQDLTIGSGTFIEGFESGLIGKKIGDKDVKVRVTFPVDYNAPELAGKDAVFTVTVNSGTRPETPKYNDAFVKSQGDYKNTDEFEEALKKEIRKQKEAKEIEDQQMALWDKVISDSEVIEYPQDEVDNYMEANEEMMEQAAKESGITKEEMLSKYGFKDEKSFKVSNKETSKLRVKQELIVAKIAENEGITYTDEEKTAMIDDFESQGYDDKSIQQQTGRTMDQYVCIQLLYEKVLDFILDNAKVK